MAVESAEQTEAIGRSCNQSPVKSTTMTKNPKGFVMPMLRILTFAATLSAVLVMALNRQTKTFVVANTGNTPIKATFTAKFHHTPAFVFFVLANAIASFHSLLMLAVEFFGHKYDFKGLRFALIPILDMLTVALVSGGANAAAFMGEVGRNGNSHARWNRICDKFETYCDRASGAMLSSFIGLLLFSIIIIISIFKLQFQNTAKYSTLP